MPTPGKQSKYDDNYYNQDLDYANAMYGYDDENVNSGSSSVTGAGSNSSRTRQGSASSARESTPQKGQMRTPTKLNITPPPRDADGSPYASARSDTGAQPQHGGTLPGSPGLCSSALLSHASPNTQANEAFGGGRSSINELLESDAERCGFLFSIRSLAWGQVTLLLAVDVGRVRVIICTPTAFL